MDFFLSLLKDTANAFLLTLAAVLATRVGNTKRKKGKRKTTPRRGKQKGGSRRK